MGARLLAPHGIDLPVVETRETVAYFRLEGEIPSVVAEVVTNAATASTRSPTRVFGLKVGRAHARQAGRSGRRRAARPGLGRARSPSGRRRGSRSPIPSPVHAESCFYTSTDDERFVLERHGRIVVGSACSGHGFKFAPAVGERLAALAVEALG